MNMAPPKKNRYVVTHIVTVSAGTKASSRTVKAAPKAKKAPTKPAAKGKKKA